MYRVNKAGVPACSSARVEFQIGRRVDHPGAQQKRLANRNPDSTKNRSSRSCPRARWTACFRSRRNFQLVQMPCEIRYGCVLEADQTLALRLSRKLKRYKVNWVPLALKE